MRERVDESVERFDKKYESAEEVGWRKRKGVVVEDMW